MRSLEELGCPRSCTVLLNRPYGLVLVVGPTGSGKSTTLAAMIDRINETKPVHILTIEDPVEYLHHHKTAMINQREVGTDAVSFEAGLRSALREDPDVVLLGEMRDLESIQIALSLAETGHLVFATLHTNDASQALDRMVDVFPAEKRDQIQTMLAGSLQGVVSQRLLPASTGGRVAAYEVLMGTEAVRNLVREGKSRQLRNVVATGGPEGMQTIEMDLARLVTSGLVTMEMAQSISAYPAEIQAQVSTLRAQSQAAATQAAGQAATLGFGRPHGFGDHWPEPHRRSADRGRRDRARMAGPRDNPFKTIAGITTCPGGWLVLPARLAGVTVVAEETFVLTKLMDVLDYRPEVRLRRDQHPVRLPRAPGRAVSPVRRRCPRADPVAAPHQRPPGAVACGPVREVAAGGARARAVAHQERLPALQVDARSGDRDPAVPRPRRSTAATPTCRSCT